MFYLKEWKALVNADEDIPDNSKQKALLSAETMEGIEITGKFINKTFTPIIIQYFYMYSVLVCGNG